MSVAFRSWAIRVSVAVSASLAPYPVVFPAVSSISTSVYFSASPMASTSFLISSPRFGALLMRAASCARDLFVHASAFSSSSRWMASSASFHCLYTLSRCVTSVVPKVLSLFIKVPASAIRCAQRGRSLRNAGAKVRTKKERRKHASVAVLFLRVLCSVLPFCGHLLRVFADFLRVFASFLRVFSFEVSAAPVPVALSFGNRRTAYPSRVRSLHSTLSQAS